MLTNFFGKSNAVNFLLLSILLVLFYFFQLFIPGNLSFELYNFIESMVIVVVLVFSLLLLDFIVRKNALNSSNNLAIFVFFCWGCMCAQYLTLHIVIANLFILMALRRIFSLTSLKNIEKKVLDASIWILLASYFYFWSLGIFVLLYWRLFQLNKAEIRYCLIPIVAFFGVGCIATTFFLIKDNSFEWIFHYPEPIGLDFSFYANSIFLINISVALAIFIWVVFFRLKNLGVIPKKNKSNYLLALYSGGVCLWVILLTSFKSGAELWFFSFPFSVLVASYVEKEKDIIFKEILLWTLLLLPFILLFI